MKQWILILTILVGGLMRESVSVGAKEPYQVPKLEEIKSVQPKQTIDSLIKALPKEASLDDAYLILVNQENRLEGEPNNPLVYDDSGIPYHEAIALPLAQLREAAAMDGFFYRIVSGYRSIAQQEANRSNQYQSYLYEGVGEGEAQTLVDLFFAPSDGSEHTTGLALDLLGSDWGGNLTVDYGYQPSAIWLADHAHEYGFVLRFQEGKTPITGINYEPWHYRYVGIANAQFMYDHQLSLEEYIALIQERDRRLEEKTKETSTSQTSLETSQETSQQSQ